ncbi:HPr family phosphocarrier protein [Desulforamulus aquiferis]|uniref:HPr family phosphocarrier protein n=1 Tax=Desulforamulus aquiferis TaxID=1397668 RepID=A0AAW7ZDT8_9FIRM|nr:HPr family phosphocarrier protein [Desulforamulus aquiferis]MDO7787924.1 HPr family phosphocarrier protein [Desulforamulus aquiferis]RYD07146.1 hypothetical protein N752_00760 [Desulforamulus aquiferis]
MLKKDLKNVINLDPQPAAKFVKAASQFHAAICLEKGGHRVNGKSMMGLMELANHSGEVITLSVEGEDALKAMETLSHLLEDE